MTQAQANNLDIAQAAARLRQADARARQAGAALLPQVARAATVNTLYGDANGTAQHETDFNAGLDASYELDFWGKNRDALESAQAARAASRADRQTVALTVTSGVATTYFQLLSLRERIAVARANLKSSQDILDLVQRRVTAGYSAPADLTQQRAGAGRGAGGAARAGAAGTGDPQRAGHSAGPAAGRLYRQRRGAGCAFAARRGAGPAIRTCWRAVPTSPRPKPISAAAHADLAAARAAFLPVHHPDRQRRRRLSGAGCGGRHLARHRPRAWRAAPISCRPSSMAAGSKAKSRRPGRARKNCWRPIAPR